MAREARQLQPDDPHHAQVSARCWEQLEAVGVGNTKDRHGRQIHHVTES